MKLGVVADDVTGASDLADAVCDEGWSAAVVFGSPEGPLPEADCVVVALKSRTAPVREAVESSVAAGRRLIEAGAPRLYQKYCSTFDSTDRGNIGPVADGLCALLGAGLSVGTPATPRSGRTVYQGHLFVGRQLLAESPLRDHPLTPMRDSDLVRLLGRQTPAPVSLVDRPAVTRGVEAVLSQLAAAQEHVL
ncbi:MAG TPA: four-carbon acid sugar kinase family protein, partial [Jatrophihabitans sp.]|nr:four-carbon acid sugar kinase family protein [Jatrophihabitans sp.]